MNAILRTAYYCIGGDYYVLVYFWTVEVLKINRELFRTVILILQYEFWCAEHDERRKARGMLSMHDLQLQLQFDNGGSGLLGFPPLR